RRPRPRSRPSRAPRPGRPAPSRRRGAAALRGPDRLAPPPPHTSRGGAPRRLDAGPPPRFEAPTGSRPPIDYAAEGGPRVDVRVQELYGLTRHPAVAGGRVPLILALLSPAHPPLPLTRALP